MRWIVLVLIAPCLFAGEFSKIEVARGKTEEVVVSWNVPPEACASKLYRWDGASLQCAKVDRLEILKMQRDQEKRAVSFLRGAAILTSLYTDARAKCREMGKLFDTTEVLCTGSLTPGEKK